MSKFLTPPVWYDSSGKEDRSLINTQTYAVGGPNNAAFGYLAVAGNPNGNSFGAVAVGTQAQATNSCAIAIGSYDENGTNRNVSAAGVGSIAIGAGAMVEQTGGMAIGRGSKALEGGIAIGENASATANQIQLGDPSSRYDLKIGNGISGTVNGVDFSSVFKTIGAVKMASKAFTIYNKTSEGNESNVVNFSGLEHTGKYLIAIRYAFKDQTTGGLTREPEGSAFIIINQNYRKDTVTYGGLSAGYINGQMAFMFPKYIKTDDATGTLQMQRCDSAGNIISNNNNIDIIMAYAILLDT